MPEPIASSALRRDAADNRARLVAAAERVFAEQGTAAGMDDIARAAGVGAATLYRRFATKDDLVRAVLEAFFARLVSLANTALAAPADESLQLFFLTVGAEIASQRGLAHRLWGELAPTVLVLDLENKTRQLVERAYSVGAIASSVTAEDVATAVRAMRGAIESDSDAWRRHVAFVLAGFRVGPEPGILGSTG